MGDRWLDPGQPSFAKNADFFMIFEVYLQSDSDCKLEGVPKEFKSRLVTGQNKTNEILFPERKRRRIEKIE